MMAIDLALDKTGIACYTDDFDDPIVWTFKTGAMTGHARDVAIIAELRRAVTLCRPELVLLEDLYAPRAGKIGVGFFNLAFLHGVVRYYLAGVSFWHTVNNQHIKIYATGKGSGQGSDKHDVMLAVERRYGHLVAIEDDNQADAFALLAMGRHKYGHPFSTMGGGPIPQTHERALTMADGWPDLAGYERRDHGSSTRKVPRRSASSRG
jgi:Holliday junction resolvasome RuvABC endonuclease subunit